MSVFWSADPTSLLVGGVVLLCVLWWMSTRRLPGLPPGPGPALPLLGHLHLLAKDPRPQFWAWRRQYGDVFSLYMGGRLVVVLASYSAIREAFVTFVDVFSHRPRDFIFHEICKKKGIAATSGRAQKEQRKTVLDILRAMGVGKNVMADKIQEEVTHYIRAIEDHQGAPADVAKLTQASISNNICSILFGKRYDHQDPEFLSYLKIMDSHFKALAGSAFLNFHPMVKYIPGDPFKAQRILDNISKVEAFVDTHIAQRQDALDNETEDKTDVPDFISSYLRQIRNLRNSGTEDTIVDEENLRKGIVDLFFGGTETTSICIRWALLFFLHHPHVQDRCFRDISDVIGPHRPPSMSDRPNLPYVEATIWEVLRIRDVVPTGLMHAPDRDVNFRGYDIPKGTMIIPFLSTALNDPDTWGDPENFRPERFIDPDGKKTKPEDFIPFSTGRRVCLGESMARMVLFLYVTTLIQHFRFLPAEEGQLPSLEGVLGLTQSPQPYTIRAVPRM